MQPLLAELRTDARTVDERGAARRTLRLEVQASVSSRDAPMALILNLSERGLLIETAADLAVGETIQVDLPEARASPARIVWTNGAFFGCVFINPVSRAAVSAALLLAPVEQPQSYNVHPDARASAPFGNEQAKSEFNPEAQSPGAGIAVMACLIISALVAAMFIYALLTFPFST